jgi:hypothetical protein
VSLTTFNGSAVIEADLSMPRVGAWVGRLVVQASEIATGLATLKIGSAELTCYAHRATVYQGRATAMLVGGRAGRLEEATRAQAFRPAPAAVVLGSTLLEAGETLATSSNLVLLAKFLPRWTRLARPAGAELAALALHLGASWRFLDTGALWFGLDTFPAYELPDRIIVGDDPDRRRMTVAGSVVHLLRPGITFEGRRVSGVALRLTPESARAELSYGG